MWKLAAFSSNHLGGSLHSRGYFPHPQDNLCPAESLSRARCWPWAISGARRSLEPSLHVSVSVPYFYAQCLALWIFQDMSKSFPDNEFPTLSIFFHLERLRISAAIKTWLLRVSRSLLTVSLSSHTWLWAEEETSKYLKHFAWNSCLCIQGCQ